LVVDFLAVEAEARDVELHTFSVVRGPVVGCTALALPAQLARCRRT